jgi:hypothetical protein
VISKLFRVILASAALVLSLGTQAQTTKVGKASFDNTIQLGGKSLVLNGAGTRNKGIFRVYAAGLYVQKKTNAVEDILNDNGPRRIQVAMFRDVDANELGRLFTRGMENNATKEEFFKAIPGTIKMSDIFTTKRQLVAGDVFTIDFVPGVGTTITVNNDEPSVPIKEPEFYRVLLKLWLGENPADLRLKTALLGEQKRTE